MPRPAGMIAAVGSMRERRIGGSEMAEIAGRIREELGPREGGT